MSSVHRLPPRRKKHRPLRPAQEWLGQCRGPAGRIIEHTKALHSIEQILAKILPEPLNLHVQAISLEGGRLTLATDAAIWATQVRHRRQQILSQISHATRQPLGQLEVRVGTLFAPPLVRKIHRQLSDQTRKQLLLTAETIDDDALSAALRRLAASQAS